MGNDQSSRQTSLPERTGNEETSRLGTSRRRARPDLDSPYIDMLEMLVRFQTKCKFDAAGEKVGSRGDPSSKSIPRYQLIFFCSFLKSRGRLRDYTTTARAITNAPDITHPQSPVILTLFELLPKKSPVSPAVSAPNFRSPFSRHDS